MKKRAFQSITAFLFTFLCSAQAFAQGSVSASFVDRQGNPLNAPAAGTAWCWPTSGGSSISGSFNEGDAAVSIANAAVGTYRCSLSFSVQTSYLAFQTSSFSVQNGQVSSVFFKLAQADSTLNVSVVDQQGQALGLANSSGVINCNNWENGLALSKSISQLPATLNLLSGIDYTCSAGSFSGVANGGMANFKAKLEVGENKDLTATAYKTDATFQVSVVDQLGNQATFSNGLGHINCSSRELPSLYFGSTINSLPISVAVVGGYNYTCFVSGLSGHVASFVQKPVGSVAAGATQAVELVAPKPDAQIVVNLLSGGSPLAAPSGGVGISCSERSNEGNGIYITGQVAQGSSSVSLPALSGRAYSCYVFNEPAGYGRLDYSKEVSLGNGASGSVSFNFEQLLGTLSVQLVAQESGVPLVVPDGSWGWVSCSSEGSARYRYYSRSIQPGQSSVSIPVKENVLYSCRANGVQGRAQMGDVDVTAAAGGTTSVQIPLRAFDSVIQISFVSPSGEPVTPTSSGSYEPSISCYNSSVSAYKQVQNGVPIVSLSVFSGSTYNCYAEGNLDGYGLSSNFSVTVPAGSALERVAVTAYPRSASIELSTMLLAPDGSASKFQRSFNGGSGHFSCYGTASDMSFDGILPNGSQSVTVAVVPGKYRCSAHAPSGFVAIRDSADPVAAAAGKIVQTTQYYRQLSGTLTLRLVDENGEPLTVPPDNSFEFGVAPSDDSFWLESDNFTVEAQESEVSGAVVPGKTYLIDTWATFPGYANPLQSTQVSVPESGSASATVTLRKLNSSIIVSLVGADGQPFPVPADGSAWVECSSTLHGASGSIDSEQFSTTLAVLGSADKTYTCRASVDGISTRAATVVAPVGGSVTAQIEVLPLNAPVTVQLVDAVTGASFTGMPGIEVGFQSIDENISHYANFVLATDTGSGSAKLAGGVPYSMWAYAQNSLVEGVLELNGKSYLLVDRSLNLNPKADQPNTVTLRVLEARATFTASLVDSSGNAVPGWISAQVGAVSDDTPGIGASVPSSGSVKIPIGVGQTYYIRAYGYGESPISAAVFITTPSEGEAVAHTFVIPQPNHQLEISPSTSDGRQASYTCSARNTAGMQTWGYQEYRATTVSMHLTTGDVWTIKCEGWAYDGNQGTTYRAAPFEYTPQGETGALSVTLSSQGGFSRLSSTVSSSEKTNLAVSSETSLSIDPGALGNGDIDVEAETRAPLANENVPPGQEVVGSLTISANNGGNPLNQFQRPITVEFIVPEGDAYSATQCTDATACEQLPVNSITPQALSKLGVPSAQVFSKFSKVRGPMAAKVSVKVSVSKPGQIAVARKVKSAVAPTPTPIPATPTPGISVGAVGNLKVKVNRKDRSATATWAAPSGHSSASYTLTLSWKEGKKNKSRVVRTAKTKYVFKKLKPLRYSLALTAAVNSATGPATNRAFSIK